MIIQGLLEAQKSQENLVIVQKKIGYDVSGMIQECN